MSESIDPLARSTELLGSVSEPGADQVPERLYASHLADLVSRYRLLMQEEELDALLIYSGTDELYPFQDDNPYPFVANPFFRQWIPQPYANAFVVLAASRDPMLIRIVNHDYWHGPSEPPFEWWRDHLKVIDVKAPTDVATWLSSSKRIAAIGAPEINVGSDTVVWNKRTVLRCLSLSRTTKSQYEIACMAVANRQAVRGHRAVYDAFMAGESELSIHHTYCRVLNTRDSELPYTNIIAKNERGSILHYRGFSRDKGESSRSLLIDAGACHFGYVSDVSRTHSVTDDDFQALVRALDAAQQVLCDEAVAGLSFETLHERAMTLIAGILVDAGIIQPGTGEDARLEVSRYFFPHGLGHYIGLQVHDVGGHFSDDAPLDKDGQSRYENLRLIRRLSDGNVVTIEPGIYFNQILLQRLSDSSHSQAINWALVERLTPFGGIRIEDNVCITASGPRNLTREALSIGI